MFEEELYEFMQAQPKIRKLETGYFARSIGGMSVVYDMDCMGKEDNPEAFKFMIVRENSKLYSEWDNPASLVF